MNSKIFLIAFAALILAQPVLAQAQDAAKVENSLKDYYSNVVSKVKNTDNPEKKRAILNDSFDDLFRALNKVEKLPSLSNEQAAFVALFKQDMQEKHEELNGLNGFERVTDERLNDFSEYVLQDFEQADKTITISLTTLLLGIIILLLIAN